MNKLPNKRSFDYDMKKLLGLETVPPPASEMVLTISGLTGGHKWLNLENGTNYIAINEYKATTDNHIVSNTNGFGGTSYQKGYFKLSVNGNTSSVSMSYRVGYMTTGSSSIKKTSVYCNFNVPTQHPSVSALMDSCWNKIATFTHMGDTVSVTFSKGTLWSKGNM